MRHLNLLLLGSLALNAAAWLIPYALLRSYGWL